MEIPAAESQYLKPIYEDVYPINNISITLHHFLVMLKLLQYYIDSLIKTPTIITEPLQRKYDYQLFKGKT